MPIITILWAVQRSIVNRGFNGHFVCFTPDLLKQWNNSSQQFTNQQSLTICVSKRQPKCMSYEKNSTTYKAINSLSEITVMLQLAK